VKPILMLSLAAAAAAVPAAAATAKVPLSTLSMPMQIVVLLSLLTLLPAALVSVTPFLRTVIVLHFLRQALGTQSTPSNQVLLGVALFVTLLVMQPVTADVYQHAWQPMQKGELTLEQAGAEAARPLRTFWVRFAREKDISMLVEASHAAPPRTPADLDLRVLIPAYILSEMKTGFQIGAVL
jgi:flagellar biosynthetic protein FliP